MRSTAKVLRQNPSGLGTWVSYPSPSKNPSGQFIIQTLDSGQLRLVDDGCGNGRYTELLTRVSSQVVALDLNSTLVSIAKRKSPAAHVVRGDLTNLPFRRNVFCRVLCVHNLSMIRKCESAIDEMNRVLRVGGKCVVDQSNLLYPRRWLDWRMWGRLAKAIIGRGFINLDRLPSQFAKPFKKMRYKLLSVSTPPEFAVEEGQDRFANCFLVVATKVS